jgi:glycosyltransferase involved in cell wall biosynthesis
MSNSLISAASFTPELIESPSAWLGHLPFAAWVIQEVSPKIFVELGTHSGHSYSAFCQSVVEAGLSTKCYAVDTWQGDQHAGEYDDDIFIKFSEYHQEKYAAFSQLLRMKFDDAVNYFVDGSIELLHIDGLHTYEAVCHDFETWLPKLAPGAVVIFHDTNVRERDFGVWRLWEELQVIYPNNLEFLHSHGLGIIQINNAPKDKKLEWLLPNSPEKKRFINYFASLGSRQSDRFELVEIKQRAANLAQVFAEREGQIASLNHSLAEREGQIASLNHSLAERYGHIVNLNLAVAEIYSSTSWKFTLPLRMVGHLFKRVRRFAELVMYAIKLGGGIKNIIRKVIFRYRSEGFMCILRGYRTMVALGQLPPKSDLGGYDKNDYAEWIRRHDTVTASMRTVMHARIEAFPQKPLISVIMPVYNPKLKYLVAAIESVRQQIYPHWELCIADDASTDIAIRPILERYAKDDARIKIIFHEKNGNISAASNSAMELATGEWVALLDHDDILSEHALFWVADAINQNCEAMLIYSDEDKIDEAGLRFYPFFKSDWNIDFFYSLNMFSHLGVYRKDLLQAVGGFREEYNGSQDYDLVLRCIERIRVDQIHHIPRVLYHWRAHQGSTSQDSDAKPYAALAGKKALNDHFQRLNINALAECVDCGYRVKYVLPNNLPLVSLIIPTRNSLELLETCLGSILNKTSYPNYEILIIDNASDDLSTLKYLNNLQANDSRIRVIRDDRAFNYSALNNAAVKLAQGEIIGLINNDIEVITPDWLSEMVSHAIRPDIGAVGAKLYFPNDTLQHGGVIIGIGGVASHAHKFIQRESFGYFGRLKLVQNFSAVTAACLLVRKEIYEKVSGLNETDLKVAFNDVDFCLRVRKAGFRNIWTPYAELYHHESASRGLDDSPEKILRFTSECQYMQRQWANLIMNDPAYSPNLTLTHDDFSFAWPPRVELISSSGKSTLKDR